MAAKAGKATTDDLSLAAAGCFFAISRIHGDLDVQQFKLQKMSDYR